MQPNSDPSLQTLQAAHQRLCSLRLSRPLLEQPQALLQLTAINTGLPGLAREGRFWAKGLLEASYGRGQDRAELSCLKRVLSD